MQIQQSQTDNTELAKALAVLHAIAITAKYSINELTRNYQLKGKLRSILTGIHSQYQAAPNLFNQIYQFANVTPEKQLIATKEQNEAAVSLYTLLYEWALIDKEFQPYAEHILHILPLHIQFFKLQKSLSDEFSYAEWVEAVETCNELLQRKIETVLKNNLKTVFRWNVTAGDSYNWKHDREMSIYNSGKIVLKQRCKPNQWGKIMEANAHYMGFAQLMNMIDQLITWKITDDDETE